LPFYEIASAPAQVLQRLWGTDRAVYDNHSLHPIRSYSTLVCSIEALQTPAIGGSLILGPAVELIAGNGCRITQSSHAFKLK
jgi:hypothetical protein